MYINGALQSSTPGKEEDLIPLLFPLLDEKVAAASSKEPAPASELAVAQMLVTWLGQGQGQVQEEEQVVAQTYTYFTELISFYQL